MKKTACAITAVSLGMVLVATMSVAAHARALAAPPGDPVKGERVFANQKCATCHPMNGKGNKIGPDLGAVGLRRDAASLAKFLVKPTPLDPNKPPIVKMPPVVVKGQDLDDLIAYLLTLKTRK
jgi:cytochrome c2